MWKFLLIFELTRIPFLPKYLLRRVSLFRLSHENGASNKNFVRDNTFGESSNRAFEWYTEYSISMFDMSNDIVGDSVDEIFAISTREKNCNTISDELMNSI